MNKTPIAEISLAVVATLLTVATVTADDTTADRVTGESTIIVVARATQPEKPERTTPEDNREPDAALRAALQNIAADNRKELEIRLSGHNSSPMLAAR